jgi:hypothetical protein
MSQILYPPARAQPLAEVLKTGVQIFRVSFNASLPYSVLVGIASELANLRNLSADLPVPSPLPSDAPVDPVYWAWYVVGGILSLLFGSALLLRQKALAAGERTSVAAEMRQSGVLLSRLIVCMALSSFAIGLFLLPLAIAWPMTGLAQNPPNLAAVNIGMLLLLIPLSLPAAWLSLGLFFATPALVLRKLGPIEAMWVSFRLLRGNWWRTSVLTAALGGVLVLMAMVVGAVAAIIVSSTGVLDLKVISTLSIPFGIVCGAIILPWCGAQVLAMMGDLTVRQDDARRAGTGDNNGTSTGPTA